MKKPKKKKALSMDPFGELSPDIHYLIFQHFTAKEILEISNASKAWNEIIGNSNSCMKKIELSLRFWKDTAGTKQYQCNEKINVLHESARQYQNVSIDCRFDKGLSNELWKFLSSRQSSLVELKIKSIQPEFPLPLTFTKLMIMKLTYVPTNIRNILLTSCCSLTKLKLKMESPFKWGEPAKIEQESLSSIRKCLELNQALKDIEIHGCTQYKLFFDLPVSDVVRFKLKTLKIKSGLRLAVLSENNERNLVSFLKTQGKCLECLYIDGCRTNIIQFIFNNMSVLRSIQIDVMMMEKNEISDLNLNESIRDLMIPYVNYHENIREFLNAVPNIESLFIAYLSHESMNFIARNLLNLKTLKFRYDENECEDFYEQLREDYPEVNQNIEMIVDYEYT